METQEAFLAVNNTERRAQHGFKPFVLWYTGFSGAGKSTIANAVDRILFNKGYHTYLLDGDCIRLGLSKDLGFDDCSRIENVRRVAEVGRLMIDAGLVVSISLISPYIESRAQARKLFGDDFIEVYIDTPLIECEKRDPKGLYKKMRSSGIDNFTGFKSPYQPPLAPELHIRTIEQTAYEAAQKVIQYLVHTHKIC